MAYEGSIDLISGIRPKNDGEFPLVNSPDILVDPETDKRLDEWIEEHNDAVAIPIDNELSSTSENPVQNKIIKAALDTKYVKPNDGIPESDLTANVRYGLTRLYFVEYGVTTFSDIYAAYRNGKICFCDENLGFLIAINHNGEIFGKAVFTSISTANNIYGRMRICTCTMSDGVTQWSSSYSDLASINSPTFSGTPFAPTAPRGVYSTTQIANVAFVKRAIDDHNKVVEIPYNSSTSISEISEYYTAGKLCYTKTTEGIYILVSLTETKATFARCVSTNKLATVIFTENNGSISWSTNNGADMAPIASPTFTGIPSAPTAPAGTNSTQLATTAFVKNASSFFLVTYGETSAQDIYSAYVSGKVCVLRVLSDEFEDLDGYDYSYISHLFVDHGGIVATYYPVTISFFNIKNGILSYYTAQGSTGGSGSTTWSTESISLASIASPTFTGTPKAPTATAGTNTTQIATTAFVKTAIDNDKASPAFTGVPTAPTANPGTNTTQIATTAFVKNAVDSKADIFIATYGLSTNSDIYAAFNNDVPILCTLTEKLYILSSCSANSAIFTANDGDYIYQLRCISNNWSTVTKRITVEANVVYQTAPTEITLDNNTEYYLDSVETLVITYPESNFNCWIRMTLTSNGSIVISLPQSSSYIGEIPVFSAGETWELSIKDGVVAACQVVSA